MLLIFCLALVMGSCNINPGLQEVSQLENGPVAIESNTLPGATLFPVTALSIVSLNKVDLYLERSTATIGGDVLVTIRDSKTSAIIRSTSLPVSSVHLFGWATFNFVPAVNLIKGNKYQIHVSRVGQESSFGNAVFWRCSPQGVDSYPDGTNSVGESGGGVLDFAFKTYTEGVIDQQQPKDNYGFSLQNAKTRWQEFKPNLVIPIFQ